jgi:hypothetical protein
MSAPNPEAPTPLAPRPTLPAAFQPSCGGSGGGGGPPGPSAPPRERAIIHLDMDCFFASATTVGRPEFSGLPLAVCHSASERGSGEVSTANYAARAFGVRSGMFMAEAKKRCPELVVVPYEFDRYERIAMEVGGGSTGGRGRSSPLCTARSNQELCLCCSTCITAACRHLPAPPTCRTSPPLTPPPLPRCTASSCARPLPSSPCPATRLTSTSPDWVTRVILRCGCERRSLRRLAAPPAQALGPTP